MAWLDRPEILLVRGPNGVDLVKDTRALQQVMLIFVISINDELL
jgi:hypothetical protein